MRSNNQQAHTRKRTATNCSKGAAFALNKPNLEGDLLGLLALLLTTQLEALATLDGLLVHQTALIALQLQHDLLGGLDLSGWKRNTKTRWMTYPGDRIRRRH
jgi:hypothetical protein